MKVIILLLILLLVVEIFLAKKEVNFIRLATCPGYKNYTAIYKNVVFTKNKQGKTVSMRLDVEFKKEIKRLMVIVTMRKCDNSENLDTCEYFLQDFKIKNTCDIIGQKNQIWSDALYNSNFPRNCPIPAGTYSFNDTKLDGDMQLALLPVTIALWKIRFFSYDSGNNNVMICCTDLDVKVYTARRN